jgi:cell division protein FtsI/penicillin-binding protein 2
LPTRLPAWGRRGAAERTQSACAAPAAGGYGQGTSRDALKMARVAGCSGGGVATLMAETEPQVSPDGDVLLPRLGADLIGAYMRDAVLTGTGRSLRSHPGRIAGKTGTAEIVGAPSHSWFVGFAPYGQATKRVAFAVIIENAGYGSVAAAPVAGEIVDAAMALGIVK